MLLPALFTTTALALTANAFLVPLEVADSAKAAASAIATGVLPSSQTINLDCSSCPFALAGAENEPHTWSESPAKTDLVMQFDTTPDKKQVTLNGVAFFPPTLVTMQHMLAAHQVIQDGEVVPADVKPYSQELSLSYSMDASEEIVEDGSTLQPVTLTILGLDGKVVNVDAISIPIVKAANGDLSLAEIKTTPVDPSSGASTCTTIMCRVRAIIVAKMAAARAAALKALSKISATKNGCMRKLGFKMPAPQRSPKVHGGPDKFRGKFHGQDGNHHGPHGYNQREGVSAMLHAIKRVFRHVLLPVLVGIAAGMAASAAGMLIGQVIVLLWVRHRRRSGVVYEVVEQVEAEEGRVSEEGLPKYEEAPKYEEVETETVDEKKELLG
ncbi:hypothetical protein MMC26_006223 [Xylographa opegraphella]|nr:hypothetical protein [Xylographa opegraphella]